MTQQIGRVAALWRYPVKSMRGQTLSEAFAGFAGIYGDRIYAFGHAGEQPGFPYLTGRQQQQMLLYQPHFRDPAIARDPPNRAAAEALGPGLTAVYPDHADLMVDVETPAGEVLAVDDPALIAQLSPGPDAPIHLLRSHRAATDCRPISLLSLATVAQLASETGLAPDARRFRANILLALNDPAGFAEDALVGRTIRIGPRVRIAITGRDPRCKMITIDPDTAALAPELLRKVARAHDGMAGVYGAVLVEGVIRADDPIVLAEPVG